MKKFRFSQTGTFSIAVLSPILLFTTVMMISGGKEPVKILVFGFISVVFLLCLLVFYKLTIEIDDSHLRFSLGVGLISVKYSLSEISSCRQVRNPVYYGIGIRKIPGGWLYNVSGQDAIELRFRNRDSVVRIGTDKPGMVAEIVNRLISSNDEQSSLPSSRENKGFTPAVILLALVFLLPVLLIIAGGRETKFSTDGGNLVISGMYGMTLKTSEISSVDTISALPAVKRRINGYAFRSTLKGRFTLKNGVRARLFVKKDSRPFIHIKANASDIFLNTSTPEGTRDLYYGIRNAIGDTGEH